MSHAEAASAPTSISTVNSADTLKTKCWTKLTEEFNGSSAANWSSQVSQLKHVRCCLLHACIHVCRWVTRHSSGIAQWGSNTSRDCADAEWVHADAVAERISWCGRRSWTLISGNWCDVIYDKFQQHYPTCALRFIYSHGRAPKSRKKYAAFWCGKAVCRTGSFIQVNMHTEDKPQQNEDVVVHVDVINTSSRWSKLQQGTQRWDRGCKHTKQTTAERKETSGDREAADTTVHSRTASHRETRQHVSARGESRQYNCLPDAGYAQPSRIRNASTSVSASPSGCEDLTPLVHWQ